MKETHDIAIKIGKPVARQVAVEGARRFAPTVYLPANTSARWSNTGVKEGVEASLHACPIEILVRAYDLVPNPLNV